MERVWDHIGNVLLLVKLRSGYKKTLLRLIKSQTWLNLLLAPTAFNAKNKVPVSCQHGACKNLVRLLLRAVHKRRQISFWPFLNLNPPCRNFHADLPNFYLLISCNIGISDPLPPKIIQRLLWMPPYVLEFFKKMWFYFPCTALNFWDFFPWTLFRLTSTSAFCWWNGIYAEKSYNMI